MTLRSFLLGSALALSSASALLVIPKVGADGFVMPDDVARLNPLEAQAAQQQQVDLLCTGCPLAIQSGDETSLVGFSIRYLCEYRLTVPVFEIHRR